MVKGDRSDSVAATLFLECRDLGFEDLKFEEAAEYE